MLLLLSAGFALASQHEGGVPSRPEDPVPVLAILVGREGPQESVPQSAVDPQEELTDEDDRPAFSDFEIQSADGDFRLMFQGKIQNDWGFFSADRDVEAVTGEFRDGTEFRRVRFGTRGVLYDWARFKVSFDFSDGEAGFRDVYLEARRLPFAKALRVGHFKEPFSLEDRTSSSNITFMERSLINALAPRRNVGVMLYDDVLDKRATWAIGGFHETDSNAFGAETEAGKALALTGRLTALPFYEDKGERLLHLGVSYSVREPDEGQVRYRSRPEAHLAPYVVNTGRFPADGVQLLALESALVWGPASLQAELAHARIDRPQAASPAFSGYYVEASYFLTGEHRPYSRSSGNFGTLDPDSIFDPADGGLGAWQLAARYSQLDLNDRGISGGEARDLGVGVNWYLNSNVHLQANYVISDLETFGNARIVEIRFHLDW